MSVADLLKRTYKDSSDIEQTYDAPSWVNLNVNQLEVQGSDVITLINDAGSGGGPVVADLPLSDINSHFDTTFSVNYGKIIKDGNRVELLCKFLAETTSDLRYTSDSIIELNNALPYSPTQEFSKHIVLNADVVGTANSVGQIIVSESDTLAIYPGFMGKNTLYDVDMEITYLTSDV
jgi:hypothetical protein